MNNNPSILIIAGEVSGDMHAGELVKEIRNIRPDISFFGIGGESMRAAGVETYYSVSEMAVMGFSEVLHKYPFFRGVFNDILQKVEKSRPDAAILIDYPGFNLKLAAKLKKMRIKTIYYVCPQVWAWHQSRIKLMSKIIDQLITIFPFEKKYFDNTGIKVDFAGHPLTDMMPTVEKSNKVDLPWNGETRVALLPGSRAHEIDRILPAMWEAASIVEKTCPDASFIIAAPSSETELLLLEKIDSLPKGPSKYRIVASQTTAVLGQAKAAMVASGTATVETALMRCPMVIAYKTAKLTYFLGKMFVKVDNIGMVNIMAGKEICPEFIQHEATPKALADALIPLLSDTKARTQMLDELEKVKESMGTGNASRKAAEIVIRTLDH